MKRKEFIKQTGALIAIAPLSLSGKSLILSDNNKRQNTMASKICTTCGTEFPSIDQDVCPICDDDRQYVPETGQAWTTSESLSDNHSVLIRKINENVFELKVWPAFAIGQRAFLILSPAGNILWDCIPLLNDPTIDFIKAKGGLKAIAFSHPHYYSTMNKWAEVFDCPVYIHKKDEPWIMYKGSRIALWEGAEKPLWNDIRMINVGGHFPGSSILRVPSLSDKGTIFCGDTLYISRSKKHIAVMHSYPNQIPLSLAEMNRIKNQVESLKFDTMHGAFDFQNLSTGVKEIFANSMKRYSQA
jgi:glyoxylase-like metal-dependent hydrolase (beta-lactamase superfamily II)